MESAAGIKVLIVDDDPLILSVLSHTLQSEAISVEQALDGKSAILKMKEISFAVIICDVHLPDISGLEVLKEAIRYQPETPRIALTGIEDIKMLVELINVGKISEFIKKPWERVEFIQVVMNCIEKFNLIHENKKLHQLIVKQNQILSDEIQIGALIHRVMLTGTVPEKTPGLNIQALTIPSKVIDGDFFDFYQPASHLLDIVMGDVMGKGLPAALVGTAVKSELTRYAIPTAQTKSASKYGFWHEDILSPNAIISHVLEKTASHLMELEFFVTLIYVRFNLEQRVISLIDCGSTKPLHYNERTKQCKLLQGGNFPLGFMAHEHFDTIDIPFSTNDLFIFYSDGLTEARNKNQEMFGIQRLVKIVEENSHLSSNKLLELILLKHQEFTKQQGFEDDFTLITVRVEEIEKAFRERSYLSKFASELSELRAARAFIAEICREIPGNEEDFKEELTLAVNEIFSNVVKHGYRDGCVGEIVIRAKVIEHGLAVEIADQGLSYDPSLVEEPSRQGRHEHGFGLYLARKVVDQMSYTSKRDQDGWNRTELIKYFKTKEDSMHISHFVTDHIMTIVLENDNLDAKEASDFKTRVKELITSTDAKQVVLDLHHVQFIDSSGLGCFLSILRTLTDQGGDLRLAAMRKPVQAVFELVNMHKIFEIYSTNQEAYASFKNF